MEFSLICFGNEDEIAMAVALSNSLSLLRYSRIIGSLTATKRVSPSSTLFRSPNFPLQSKRRCIRLISSSINEEASARTAAESADGGGPTIFEKIIAKEIPSTIVYEDDKVLAFRDINPQAPVHVVLIPKYRDGLTQLGKAEPRHTEILGHLLHTAKVIAEKEGILDGFRVVINNGPGGCKPTASIFPQSVDHVIKLSDKLQICLFLVDIPFFPSCGRRSIGVSPSLACTRRQTNEMASRMSTERFHFHLRFMLRV